VSKSNLSEIAQNTVTGSGTSTIDNILNLNKVTGEPNLDLSNIDYTKVTVYEFPSNATIIIDSTTGNVRIIEIHPSGSYTAKLNNGDILSKAAGNNLIFVKKDSIEIIDGKKEIKAKDSISLETTGGQESGIVSATKLVNYLKDVVGNSGALIFTDITTDKISYQNITAKGE